MKDDEIDYDFDWAAEWKRLGKMVEGWYSDPNMKALLEWHKAKPAEEQTEESDHSPL